MSNLTIFIQIYDHPGILEREIHEAATIADLHDVLAAAGVVHDADTFIFVDEFELEQRPERHHPVSGLKHGSRIHVCRCKRVKTTVHFLEKTAEHEFPPGTRLRTVKEWAVREFKLNPKDAAEHVLQMCSSTKRPPTDTPLHELLPDRTCALCFDLVPEKRVEG